MLGTLCSLITALTCVDAVIVLTQTPAVHTASPGQEVVLKCNIQRYDGNYVRWYKQVPGKAPQYVLSYHGTMEAVHSALDQDSLQTDSTLYKHQTLITSS
ncbi:Immunoglobulin kappa variable 1D-8 [Channa argus]|nr:Immunoglobulin kappa variable 1D-8 [Channa argus]